MSRFESSYLTTRLNIFSRRLIQFGQLVSFIDLDIDRILENVNAITGHGYKLDSTNTHPVENQLLNRALDDFQILIRPFSGAERRFFYFAIRWFELVNLKILIRGKFSSVDNAEVERRLVDLGGFADLPLRNLLETDDPYEMLRLLETTAYAGIVRQARRVYEEYGNDLFLLDATIDRSFFIDLDRRAGFLNEDDSEQLDVVIGGLLDRFNLLWLLRFRFSYGLSPAKSFYLLTAIGRKLKSVELMRLAKMESVEEVIAALPDPYRKLLSNVSTISDMEAVMDYYTMSTAAGTLHSNASLVSRIFAYILLREAEVRFLQALIKGKQLEFDRDLIKQAVGVVA
ncbi:MAG: V-type ATPase subunit [Gammaproteobacteria bacterium]|nr:V-type ATPase subunit [Gammaproteobacteria bacterium]